MFEVKPLAKCIAFVNGFLIPVLGKKNKKRCD